MKANMVETPAAAGLSPISNILWIIDLGFFLINSNYNFYEIALYLLNDFS